ncbi:S9 family peptidase, partial [Bacteroidia bacterium]|nr:S9 family peptidase [Bacteroidia bacterium]
TLNYWMLKPNNMDPDKTYPLLMYCYGGPGNSISRNRYNRYGQWFQYLASKGYVVVCVDNRGTGNKGSEFQKCTYKQLGKIEQEDQRFAAEYFGRLPFIDKSRIGIWGWSFGGYLTSLCMTKSPDIFKMGIAVAPVTHWKYYDNIYTERYLQRPQDNPSGYDDNSPINFAKNIKGKYLIVHGTGDDNVHFQNTAEMINAMIKENVKFDSEIYPNRAHGISDRAARRHLFDRLTKFVLENL